MDTIDFGFPGEDVRTLSEKGVPMPLSNEKGQPLVGLDSKPVLLTVLGPESLVYREGMQNLGVDRVARLSAGHADFTFEEYQGRVDDLLARCVVAWEGVCTMAGEPIPCTFETVRAFFQRYPQYRRQVDTFQAKRANFTMAS